VAEKALVPARDEHGIAAELRKLMALALPVAGTQLASMALGLVDTAMVGRVSVEAMAALALANVWIHAILMFGHGVICGLDPIVTQAHGARDGERAGLALQHGSVWALLISVPAALCLVFTDRVLIAFGQQPEIAAVAADFARVQIPSLPFFFVSSALRQYLQGREIVRPALYVMLLANGVNAFGNWLLIFGHLGLPALGVVGSGLATCLTRVLSALVLIGLTLRYELHRDAWVPWSRAALDPRGLARVARFGIPIAVQISLEIWAFSAAALLAGILGPAPVAAHTIALNMAGLAFMLPLGLSMGACTRVGNLIGAGQPQRAQRSAQIALALGGGMMTVSALAFLLLRHQIPLLFTDAVPVVELAAAVLPVASAFQIFDGTQAVGCGILRGMGTVRPTVVFNLVGYWLIALPVAAVWGLRLGGGLTAIWWGMCLGLAVVASLLVLWIRVRGPAHAVRTR
jgi:multidrug resistance protein, MATE family